MIIQSSSLRVCLGILVLASFSNSSAAQLKPIKLAVQEGVNVNPRTDYLSPALERVIALELNNVPIADAIGEIGRQADLPLVYSTRILPEGRRITLRAPRITAGKALDQVLAGTNLMIRVLSRGQVVIVPYANSAVTGYQPSTPHTRFVENFVQPFAGISATVAQGSVRGRVVDAATRAPLSGASVLVVGTGLGVLTEPEGTFVIDGIPDGQIRLRATLIGYQPGEQSVTIATGESTSVNFNLTQQAIALEGIVAVGYGTIRSQDVTGAVVGVDMENIDALPLAGATEALAGQIPGVQVITSTGAPGSGAQIRVRGVSAVGAGGIPLYVVDGFPITGSSASGESSFTMRSPLNDIPLNDIESITVLKDASAAAIYGSRASNGVVIITTKKGRAGGSPQVNISASAGMQYVNSREMPQLANAREFALFEQRNHRSRNVPVPEVYQNPNQYGEGTNWFEEVMRPAPTLNLQASVSGGSERVRSYFSAGLLDQKGVLLNSRYQRTSVRANLEADVTEGITVGLNLAPTYSIRNLAEEGGNARSGGLGSVQIASPLVSPYDENGELRPMIQSPGTFNVPNPILVLQETDNRQRTLRALGTAFLNYEPTDGLDLRTSLNIDWANHDENNFRPSVLGGTNNPPPTVPVGIFETQSFLGWLSETTVSYDRAFGDAHRIQALGGFTVQQEETTTGNFVGRQFPDDDIPTLNAAGTITGTTGESNWSLMSWLGRINYSLNDRYVFTGTVRTDGSSRFGANNRWGTFPSAAVAWKISEEPFMQNVGFAQDVKLRASIGFTGNNQIGNYSHLGQVVRADYTLGGQLRSGRRLATLQNPDLGWERTREFNVGLDAFFLNYRLELTADVYQRNTQDLLLSLELPTTSGYGSVVANRGNVLNRGVELALTSVNVDRENFLWNTNFNIAINRNEVLALGADDEPLRTGASMEGSPTHITMVGKPVGLFYGYRIEGLYLTPEDLETYPVYAGATVGTLRYKDVDRDGVISRGFGDFEVIGSPYPDFTFGLTNNLTVGRFDLRVITDGAVGEQRLLRSNASFENINGIFNVTRRYVENMWVSPEQPGDGKTPTWGSDNASRMFRDVSDRWVADASYFWVRNISLGYNVPDGWLGFDAGSAKVNLSVQNALLFSPYEGNPQASTNQSLSVGGPTSTSLTPGVDNFSYPQARTITLGLDLSF